MREAILRVDRRGPVSTIARMFSRVLIVPTTCLSQVRETLGKQPLSRNIWWIRVNTRLSGILRPGKRLGYSTTAARELPLQKPYTNVGLDWWVNMVGDGLRMAHIKTAHSCSLLCHGTLDWLWWAYTKVRMFSTYCRSETLTKTQTLTKRTDLILAQKTKEPQTSPNLN